MNIVKAFKSAFKRGKEKHWEYIYVMVDIHGTVFVPSYYNKEEYKYYPYAYDVLNILSEREEVKLILWTSSTQDSIDKYIEKFKSDNIKFDYVNENPEIVANENDPASVDFSSKFYFNVGIDDKFGFDPETDWEEILKYINPYK